MGGRGGRGGFDSIDINIFKQTYDVNKNPLMLIFDSSLQSGIFPDKWKIARVSPIFKTGEKSQLTNY